MRLGTCSSLMILSLTLPAVGGADAAKAPAAPVANPAPAPAPGMRRFMVVRTFPAGALDGLDTAGKKQVNEKNATLGP